MVRNPKTASAFHKRLLKILVDEEVKYDDKVIAQLVSKYFPDFRRTINELQRYSVRGRD